MATAILTENDVRMFIQDKSNSNTLVDGVRFSSEAIDKAMIMAVDAFNLFPPPTGNSYTVESFPNRYLLLLGTVGYLLRGTAVNEAANNFAYSADGVQINDKDKAQSFVGLGQQFWDEFRTLSIQMKNVQNTNLVWGSIGSEFGYYAR